MDEIITPEAATEELDATTETADTAADAQEAASTASEQDGEDEDTPEAETPQKPTATPSAPSMEERMLEMLLHEKHPDTLATALANGKTIRGAWNYVVSVMKNAYITAHGRINGGMCGTPDVVVGIAERYLREFSEGYTEPEAAHTPKKPSKTDGKANAAKTAVATVKAAANAAKKEAKKKDSDILGKAPANWQPTLF
jgi:hypothetical protein